MTHSAKITPADVETLCQFAHRAGVELHVTESGSGIWYAASKPALQMEIMSWDGTWWGVAVADSDSAEQALNALATKLSGKRVRKFLQRNVFGLKTWTYYDLTRTKISAEDKP